MWRHWLYRKPDPSIRTRQPPGAATRSTLVTVFTGSTGRRTAGMLENWVKSWVPMKHSAARLQVRNHELRARSSGESSEHPFAAYG